MNILEHIKAGHYPKDAQGRAVISRRGFGPVTVLSTEGRFSPPITAINASGEVQGYDADGNYKGSIGIQNGSGSGYMVLLPPVKIVKSLGFAVYDRALREFVPDRGFDTREEAEKHLDTSDPDEVVVELKAEVYPT